MSDKLFKSTEGLTECHRMFLRMLTVKGCMSIIDATKSLEYIQDNFHGVTGNKGGLDLPTVVRDLRAALVEFHFDIRSSNSERDGGAFISCVNTLDDGPALDKAFKNEASALVMRVLLTYMQQNPSKPLHSDTAQTTLFDAQAFYLRQATDVGGEAEGSSSSSSASKTFVKVSKHEWQAALSRLLEHGYLESSGDEARQTLLVGPRARAELRNVLASFVGGRECEKCGTPCVLVDEQASVEGKTMHSVCKAGKFVPFNLSA